MNNNYISKPRLFSHETYMSMKNIEIDKFTINLIEKIFDTDKCQTNNTSRVKSKQRISRHVHFDCGSDDNLEKSTEVVQNYKKKQTCTLEKNLKSRTKNPNMPNKSAKIGQNLKFKKVNIQQVPKEVNQQKKINSKISLHNSTAFEHSEFAEQTSNASRKPKKKGGFLADLSNVIICKVENNKKGKGNATKFQEDDIQLNSAKLKKNNFPLKYSDISPRKTRNITKKTKKNDVKSDTKEIGPKRKLRSAAQIVPKGSDSTQTISEMSSSKSAHLKNNEKYIDKNKNFQEDDNKKVLKPVNNLNATKPRRDRSKKQIDSTNLLTNSIKFEQKNSEELKRHNFALKYSEIVPQLARRNITKKSKRNDLNEKIINKENNSFPIKNEKHSEDPTDSITKNAGAKGNNRKLRGKK